MIAAIEHGATLTQALEAPRMIDTRRLLPFVQPGEAGGTLPHMLLHHAGVESEAIDLFQQRLAAWLPRILNVCAVVWLIVSIGVGQPTRAPEIGKKTFTAKDHACS